MNKMIQMKLLENFVDAKSDILRNMYSNGFSRNISGLQMVW